MSRITHTTISTATRLGRLGLAALVAGAVFVSLPADGADARPRSTSEVVAGEAARALNALESWELTHDPVDYVRFVQARDVAASITAAELEIEAAQLGEDWAAVSSEKQRAVLAALSQLGVPYRNLESQPGVGFDCSGLTIWAFEQAGVEVPRNSGDQFDASTEIELDEAEVGDLVYYPGHIAIYLGADLMVHSPETGSHVEVVGLPTRKSLRYGDVVSPLLQAEAASPLEPLSTLVDRAAAVTQ